MNQSEHTHEHATAYTGQLLFLHFARSAITRDTTRIMNQSEHTHETCNSIHRVVAVTTFCEKRPNRRQYTDNHKPNNTKANKQTNTSLCIGT